MITYPSTDCDQPCLAGKLSLAWINLDYLFIYLFKQFSYKPLPLTKA